MTKNIPSGSPFESKIGFSRARRIGNTIAVSGTAPICDDGSIPDGVHEQVLRCLEIIERAIEEAGADLGDMIRTRVMLVDIRSWEEAARAHASFFDEVRPACTFVEVSGFIDPNWLVEIEADAILTQ